MQTCWEQKCSEEITYSWTTEIISFNLSIYATELQPTYKVNKHKMLLVSMWDMTLPSSVVRDHNLSI